MDNGEKPKKNFNNKLKLDSVSPEDVLKALLQVKPEDITKKQAIKNDKKK